ncbi:MAG: hypothetical protein J7578_06980 [Chitinophagaceae bacterium]|nr:hypothetical protein [Chitinophagaceae bacterium]
MQEYPKDDKKPLPNANEAEVNYVNSEAKEFERLKKHIYMSDMDKLHSFTRMLIRNATLKKAIITHHK